MTRTLRDRTSPSAAATSAPATNHSSPTPLALVAPPEKNGATTTHTTPATVVNRSTLSTTRLAGPRFTTTVNIR
ncbi:hypothetical protein ABZU76_44195 [Amycolatopsis sp. NPDC005232]|uniref:hypothetical protein n=1 Tax=Amycolatopsis sp. NPDC005232 TaxID=3157027 RepID=UPI0033AC972C